MPEPDFEQIARRLFEVVDDITDATVEDARQSGGVDLQRIEGRIDRALARVAEQLRQVWNARGAADLVQLKAAADVAEESGYRSLMELDEAIRSLDR
jgi:hypothetical protein